MCGGCAAFVRPKRIPKHGSQALYHWSFVIHVAARTINPTAQPNEGAAHMQQYFVTVTTPQMNIVNCGAVELQTPFTLVLIS
eukprot:scaffold1747_cov108-Isochrysis_galbana.AAC.3